jgi:hypothetical protein
MYGHTVKKSFYRNYLESWSVLLICVASLLTYGCPSLMEQMKIERQQQQEKFHTEMAQKSCQGQRLVPYNTSFDAHFDVKRLKIEALTASVGASKTQTLSQTLERYRTEFESTNIDVYNHCVIYQECMRPCSEEDHSKYRECQSQCLDVHQQYTEAITSRNNIIAKVDALDVSAAASPAATVAPTATAS